MAAELAEVIMSSGADFPCKLTDETDLLRVSECFDDQMLLYQSLHEVFSPRRTYPPTPVHRFFVEMPNVLAAKGYALPPQLIVTTNYDHVLEVGLSEHRIPFDVVAYRALDPNKGKFVHLRRADLNYASEAHGDAVVIMDPSSYDGLPIDSSHRLERTIVLKIHGNAHPDTHDESHFVISEQDYIDYLIRMNPMSPLPALLSAKMLKSRFLFLGYSLSDWNVRVMLLSLWVARKLRTQSWAVVKEENCVDRYIWEKRYVDILTVPLEQYFQVMTSELNNLSPAPGSTQ